MVAEARSPDHVAYGHAFRQVRGERGISQERLADLAGLDRTYVSGIERGERNPSLTNLLRLASTLDVRLREVATRADAIGEGGPPLPPPSTPRHPISHALAQAAIGLKGLNQITAPIDRNAARDILYDATRLVAELIETLEHYEAQSGDKTGVVGQLIKVLDWLEADWQQHLPPLLGEES